MFPSRDPSFRRVVVKTRWCYGVFTLAGTKVYEIVWNEPYNQTNAKTCQCHSLFAVLVMSV